MNLYNILGVPRDSTPEHIKAVFRSKAKSTHPDAGGDPAQFTAIAAAYEVLGDPQKRAHYDATGETKTGGPEDERREALGIIDIIFAEVMNQLQDYTGLVCNDLVADMRKVITDKMGELDQGIAQTRDRIGRLHKFMERFTVSEGENTLTKMIEYRCTGYEKRLAGMGHGKRLHEVALQIIEHQGFTVDPNPQPVPMQVAMMQQAAQGGVMGWLNR